MFCNFQVNNWADLLPFMEFAHNARAHSATGKSPFEVWYGYCPEFNPPAKFTTTIPTVEEQLRTMNQVRSEVMAALKVASDIIKRTRPSTPSYVFQTGDLVWLEGTNIHTTHPKAKLAPRRNGPFKVVSTTATNSKLVLSKTWCVHPVFHNSLLSPYKETTAHGPNYTRPPPDIVNREEEHYEVEKVLQLRPTPNQKGVQYLIKWKGYPSSENSWLPATQMKHAADLVKEFHSKFPKAPWPPNIRSLQTQQDLKEGMLSQTVTPELWKHVTMGRSHDQTGSDPSRDPPHDRSRDLVPNPASKQSCDKEQKHDLMHAYFCRRNLCYIHNRY